MREGEWEIYQTDEIVVWMESLRRDTPYAAGKVEAAADVLSEYGPTLGRPLVDTLTGSNLANVKELRPADDQDGAVRLRTVEISDPAVHGGQGRAAEDLVRAHDPASRGTVPVCLEERAKEEEKGSGMSQFSKWNRDAYHARVGKEKAARHRGAIMAEQWGYQLAEQRQRLGFTQAGLAEIMGVTPGRVSQIEHGEVSTVEALANYIVALGGRLELIADIGGHLLKMPANPAA